MIKLIVDVTVTEDDISLVKFIVGVADEVIIVGDFSVVSSTDVLCIEVIIVSAVVLKTGKLT